MFVTFWNRLSCHDVLEKMTSESNLEIPTDRKYSGSAVNVLHALPNIFGCRRRRVNTCQFHLLCNLTNISVFFLSKRFPSQFPVTISRDITLTSTQFLSCGARVCLLHFLGIFTYIFVLYTGSDIAPELCVVARWRI